MITLKVDYEGNPEIKLEVASYEKVVECELLEVFIRKAIQNGITINRTCFENTCDKHAVISIKKAV